MTSDEAIEAVDELRREILDRSLDGDGQAVGAFRKDAEAIKAVLDHIKLVERGRSRMQDKWNEARAERDQYKAQRDAWQKAAGDTLDRLKRLIEERRCRLWKNEKPEPGTYLGYWSAPINDYGMFRMGNNGMVYIVARDMEEEMSDCPPDWWWPMPPSPNRPDWFHAQLATDIAAASLDDPPATGAVAVDIRDYLDPPTYPDADALAASEAAARFARELDALPATDEPTAPTPATDNREREGE
jgi:hypothetical protein